MNDAEIVGFQAEVGAGLSKVLVSTVIRFEKCSDGRRSNR